MPTKTFLLTCILCVMCVMATRCPHDVDETKFNLDLKFKDTSATDLDSKAFEIGPQSEDLYIKINSDSDSGLMRVSQLGFIFWAQKLIGDVANFNFGMLEDERGIFLGVKGNPHTILRINPSNGDVVESLVFSGLKFETNWCGKIEAYQNEVLYFTTIQKGSPNYAMLCRLEIAQTYANCIKTAIGATYIRNFGVFNSQRAIVVGRRNVLNMEINFLDFSTNTSLWGGQETYCLSNSCSFRSTDSAFDDEKEYFYVYAKYADKLLISSFQVTDGSILTSFFEAGGGCDSKGTLVVSGQMVYIFGVDCAADASILHALSTNAGHISHHSSFTFSQTQIWDSRIQDPKKPNPSLLLVGSDISSGNDRLSLSSIHDSDPQLHFQPLSVLTYLDSAQTSSFVMGPSATNFVWQAYANNQTKTAETESYTTAGSSSAIMNTIMLANNYTLEIVFNNTTEEVQVMEGSSINYIMKSPPCVDTPAITLTWVSPDSKVTIIDSEKGVISVSAPSSTHTVELTYKFDVLPTKNFTKTLEIILVTCEISHCAFCHEEEFEKCTECDDGYEVDSSGKCVREGVSPLIDAATKSNIVISGLIFSMSGLTTVFSVSSPNTFWAMIGQFQLLMLLPLVGGYLHKDIVDYCVGSDFALFSFSFIPNIPIPGVTSALDYLDYDQSDSYLERVELESGSGLLNIYPTIQMVAFIILFHCCFYLIFRATKGYLQPKYPKLERLLNKFTTYLTFGVYIRLGFETFLFVILASSSEISSGNYNLTSHVVSKLLSILLFLLSTCSLILLFYVIYQTSPGEVSVYLKEIFYGLREGPLSKYFYCAKLGRKLLCCGWVIFLRSFPVEWKVGVYALIQFVYFVILCWQRPFEETSNNFIEITNEGTYFAICAAMGYFYKEEHWNSAVRYVFIAIFTANNLVMLSVSIMNTYLLLRTKFSKKKIEAKSNIPQVPNISNVVTQMQQNRVEQRAKNAKVPPQARKPSIFVEDYEEEKVAPKIDDKEQSSVLENSNIAFTNTKKPKKGKPQKGKVDYASLYQRYLMKKQGLN